MNCAYRMDNSYSSPTCLLSGNYITVERMSPTRCGKDFENWKQVEKKDNIFKRMLKLFSKKETL